jgi:competence protein ComEA
MRSTQNTWIKEYFTFSKKERRAVILLAIFAVLFSMLPTFLPFLVKEKAGFIIDEESEKKLAAMRMNDKKQDIHDADDESKDWYQPKKTNEYTASSKQEGELFFFDPNTATEEDWKRLGIREKTIQTILKYRSKGGRFKKSEDISRIYGLSAKDVERLMPFVKLETEAIAPSPPSSITPNSYSTSENKSSFKDIKSKPIDINTADTAQWKTLKGIGSYYAKKIVGFREKLGGFASVEQVAETFGLPDSTYRSIKPYLQITSVPVKKININTASVDELKSHPYIKYHLANSIVQYRNQHGNFSALADLKKLGAIDEPLYQRIAPYLTIH